MAGTYKYSQSACTGRVLLKDLFSSKENQVGKEITVAGWVKTGREQGKGTFAFLQVTDGTCSTHLQVIVNAELHNIKELLATGTAISVRGTLVESPGNEQAFELQATEILYVGACDPKTYPLSKKGHSLAFLRSIAHFRPRANLFGCVFRIRNALAHATHLFFQERHFFYVHSPLITASDCEGAGEMFQVTTLLPSPGQVIPDTTGPSAELVKQLKTKVEEKGNAVRELKAAKAGKDEITAAVKELTEAKAELAQVEATPITVGGLPQTPEKTLDYSRDFFASPTFLTVSGQLQAEIFAQALSNVYTFGPTFRAEVSHTARHLAEFWMIEPEIAFANLEDVMQLAEDYVRHCCNYVLEHNLDDLKQIDEYHDFQQKLAAKSKSKTEENTRTFTEPAVTRLQAVANTGFKRVSYTEAIELLLKSGKKFTEEVSWGIDLSSEHERYLAEEIFHGPTIIYNYPKGIKAFYMRQNEDGKTVAAMDVICPQIGELIGGSQREERYDVLSDRLKELDLKEEDFWWYMDLRKFGTVPHSGFGLGFERLIMFTTGIENIRDVVPFPRYPEVCNF